MRIFLRAIIVHLLINIYVFWRGWQGLPAKRSIRVPYTLLFVIELIIYLIGFIFHETIPLDWMSTISWIGGSWTIFILYMAIMLLLYDLVYITNKRLKYLPEKINFTSRKTRFMLFSLGLMVVIPMMSWGSYRFRNPVITEKNLIIEKANPKHSKVRIVMVSDLHIGALIQRNMLAKYIDLINEQKPDLVLIVGDIIDFNLKPILEQQVDEEFKRIEAPLGVYGSTGNHDYIQDKHEESGAKIKWLTDNSGIHILRDTHTLVDSFFYVVGREDDKCLNRKQISDIMSGIDQTKPIILLNHEPHRLQEDADSGADLALYGHTHNGQIFPWNYVVSWFYEKSYGYLKKDNTHIYISSGLGLSGPQYRIGTVSEIVVLNLEFRNESIR
ncbi:metallophosphoesterase [Dysgonomonas massiliensis]|uniref:metallophosphoesterase n=1 Tax=Dysgonomonas massiliensis TaxID=2040292 RepID=UPI000C7753E8|nr:metallophosphoesterase [Dysgonomonas massiliensis]